ncbi:hypothetical protein Tsubulata_011692, partial [Turnera subulata]
KDFPVIGEYFGRQAKKSPVTKLANSSLHIYLQVNQDPAATKVIDYNEAALRYGGKVYRDYPKGKRN